MNNEHHPASAALLFPAEPHLLAKPMTGPNGAQIGWGLFARRVIKPGEIVIPLDWGEEERTEVLSWDDIEEEQHNRCAALAPRWYFYVNDQHPFWYINHSCEANVAFQNWAECAAEEMVPLVALRNIQPGEQVTLDYSFTITGDDGLTDADFWTMDCLCGALNCRRLLTCFSKLPPDVQRRELLRRTPVCGTIPAFILNEVPELVAELKREAPDLYESFQTTMQSQLRRAAEFEEDYDPNEPYYLA